MTPEAVSCLEHCVYHVKRIKYSSIALDGTLLKASTTRIDGQHVILIPYLKQHVPTFVKRVKRREQKSREREGKRREEKRREEKKQIRK